MTFRHHSRMQASPAHASMRRAGLNVGQLRGDTSTEKDLGKTSNFIGSPQDLRLSSFMVAIKTASNEHELSDLRFEAVLCLNF